MATPDEEIQYLKEKNTELAKKVQYWIMTAGQREDEKVALIKENNELRLKLSMLRSSGGALAANLDATIQTASQQALAYLIKASTEMAQITEVTKAYMRDRRELEETSPRWNTHSVSPTAEKADRVHRVPPMMMGGQSIQPVVALSRTMLNTSNLRPESGSINPNRSVTVRAVPMHMLQDVYIPLTRIDAGSRQTNSTNVESGVQNESAENSAEDSDIEDCIEDGVVNDSQNMSESEEYQQSRLGRVTEEVEPEVEVTPPRIVMENPLEGPSWLLDAPSHDTSNDRGKPRVNLEPDSTTGTDEIAFEASPIIGAAGRRNEREEDVVALHVFTPTVRRRKRARPAPAAPAFPPRSPLSPRSPLTPRSPRSPLTPRSPIFSASRSNPVRRNSISGRVLKVLVAKMRLVESDQDEDDVSPPKKSVREPVAAHSPFASPPGESAGSILGGSAGSILGGSAGSIPGGSAGSIPGGSAGSIPGGNAGSIPGGSAGSIPGGSAGSIPGGSAGIIPGGSAGSAPGERAASAHGENAASAGGGSGGNVLFARFDAPSPNGATDARVIVSETKKERESSDHGRENNLTEDSLDNGLSNKSGDMWRNVNRRMKREYSEGRPPSASDSDSAAEGRTRRNRKPVTYAEKPLNRKMRR